MACTSGVGAKPFSTSEITAATADSAGGATTTISSVHPDIIETHILTRLHGPALASAASTSSQLHALASEEHLWVNICHSTWPSTNSPRIRHVISSFPCGSRSFFPDAFATSLPTRTTATHNSQTNLDRTPQLISAVDLHFRQQLILSKVVETETVTGWFRCSPFRVDLLDPKDVVQTPIKCPKGDDACRELGEEFRLSWIVIDPIGRRAMNLSSQKPVSVQRHWLSGEVQVLFASILAGERGSSSEFALCSLMVTCGGAEGGEMQVREASLQMEDMDGMHLNGRESLVILQRALESKNARKIQREEEGRKRYKEYLEMKEERKERKLRAEGTLDMVCVVLAALSFAGFFCLLLFWR